MTNSHGGGPLGSVTILRLGHRVPRDERMTTHVALTSRAFGAAGILVDRKDPRLERTIASVVRRFGGSFSITTGVNWRKTLKEWRGTTVHLSMYGLPLEQVLPRLGPSQDILVVVGAEKVPREVYEMVHHNVAVGNQPHSEVAALAVFLDRFWGQVASPTGGAAVRVIPTARGKVALRAGTTPTPSEAEAILVALGVPAGVREHCHAVARWAGALARAAGADDRLVDSAALLHDVGRARTQGWDHGTEGANLLRELGVSEGVCRIVECHMGSGLTPEEASARGLPPTDLLPRTPEAKIVVIADRMIRGTTRVTMAEALEKVRSMGLPTERFQGYVDEIQALIGKPLEAVRAA